MAGVELSKATAKAVVVHVEVERSLRFANGNITASSDDSYLHLGHVRQPVR